MATIVVCACCKGQASITRQKTTTTTRPQSKGRNSERRPCPICNHRRHLVRLTAMACCLPSGSRRRARIVQRRRVKRTPCCRRRERRRRHPRRPSMAHSGTILDPALLSLRTTSTFRPSARREQQRDHPHQAQVAVRTRHYSAESLSIARDRPLAVHDGLPFHPPRSPPTPHDLLLP